MDMCFFYSQEMQGRLIAKYWKFDIAAENHHDNINYVCFFNKDSYDSKFILFSYHQSLSKITKIVCIHKSFIHF